MPEELPICEDIKKVESKIKKSKKLISEEEIKKIEEQF